jgi:hypothetical protein
MKDETPYRSGKPVAVFLAIVFIGAALIKWWPSDTRAIRRQLDAVADVVSVPPAESDVSRVARLADFRSYFAADVHIRMSEVEISSRDEMLALVARWTAPSGGVFVEFADEKIVVADNGTAHVETTAKVSTRDSATGDTNVDERPAAFDLAKRDGDWIITGVESRVDPAAR